MNVRPEYSRRSLKSLSGSRHVTGAQVAKLSLDQRQARGLEPLGSPFGGRAGRLEKVHQQHVRILFEAKSRVWVWLFCFLSFRRLQVGSEDRQAFRRGVQARRNAVLLLFVFPFTAHSGPVWRIPIWRTPKSPSLCMCLQRALLRGQMAPLEAGAQVCGFWVAYGRFVRTHISPCSQWTSYRRALDAARQVHDVTCLNLWHLHGSQENLGARSTNVDTGLINPSHC